MASSRSSKVLSLSLAQGLMTLVSVVSGMIFARYLSVSDYATYLQTFLAYDFFVPILTLGLPSALYYFLPGTKDSQKGVVIDNLTLLFVAGMIFSLFLIFGGTNLVAERFDNPDLKQTLRWMVLYPLYTFPVVLNAVLVVQEKIRINALYNIVTSLLLTLSIILAALYTEKYMFPTQLRIFIPILFFPLSLYFTFKYLSGFWRMPSVSSMWKILKFSLPLGIATVCGTITLQLANIVVSLFCSPSDYAIYATGAKEIPIVGIITGSIAVITMSEMTLCCKNGEKGKALEIFRKSIVISGCFMIPIMVFLLVYAKDFIGFLYTSKYNGSVVPFSIYLLFLPVRSVYFGSAFMALGRSSSVLYRGLIELVLTFVFCYIFVRNWGIYGAALAPIVTVYLFSVPYNIITLKHEFNCRSSYLIPLQKLFQIFSISVFSIILPSIMKLLKLETSNSLINILFGLSAFLVVYVLLAYKKIPEFSESLNNRILCLKKKM